MNEIENYVERIVTQINADEQKKAELREELLDHLELLKADYMNQGFATEEAETLAISDFGNPEEIGSSLRKTAFEEGNSMIRKWTAFLGLAFLLIGGLCLQKFFSLWHLQPDGDGIGIYFLWWEINDRVAAANINTYAYGSLAIGLMGVMLAILTFVFLKKRGHA